MMSRVVSVALLALAVSAASAAPSTDAFADAGSKTGVCVAFGDVHMLSFDNQRYDAMGSGNWVLTRTTDGFFEVQARQAPWIHNLEHATVAKDVAVKCAKDIVELRATGGKPAGGPVSVQMLINGLEVTLAAEEERILHSPADHAKIDDTSAKLFKVVMLRRDGTGLHFRVDCNARGGEDTPGGFVVDVVSNLVSDGVYVDTMIRADKQNPKCKCEEQMEGLCGWTPDAMDAKLESAKCLKSSFNTEACKSLVTVISEKSLFKDKKWHATRAATTPITVDPAKLRQAKERCVKIVESVVPDDKDLPEDVADKLKGMEKDCAFDVLYGLPAKTEAMRDVVCSYGQTQVDSLRAGLRAIFKELHCSYSYSASLELGKKSSQQDAFQRGMEAAAEKTTQIREFCFEGCKCGPTETETEGGFSCGTK